MRVWGIVPNEGTKVKVPIEWGTIEVITLHTEREVVQIEPTTPFHIVVITRNKGRYIENRPEAEGCSAIEIQVSWLSSQAQIRSAYAQTQ